MHIFASVCLTAHPSKSAELLKYIHNRKKIEAGKTSVCVNNFFVKYLNRYVAYKIVSGFSVGFRLHYSGPRTHLESSNLVLAHTHLEDSIEKS